MASQNQSSLQIKMPKHLGRGSSNRHHLSLIRCRHTARHFAIFGIMETTHYSSSMRTSFTRSNTALGSFSRPGWEIQRICGQTGAIWFHRQTRSSTGPSTLGSKNCADRCRWSFSTKSNNSDVTQHWRGGHLSVLFRRNIQNPQPLRMPDNIRHLQAVAATQGEKDNARLCS